MRITEPVYGCDAPAVLSLMVRGVLWTLLESVIAKLSPGAAEAAERESDTGAMPVGDIGDRICAGSRRAVATKPVIASTRSWVLGMHARFMGTSIDRTESPSVAGARAPIIGRSTAE